MNQNLSLITQGIFTPSSRRKVGSSVCDTNGQTRRRKHDGLGLFCWRPGWWLAQSVWHLVGQWFILQQENDPKHSSRHTSMSELCYNEKYKMVHKNMEWLAQSPGLNPTELVWDELDRRLKRQQLATHICGCFCNSAGKTLQSNIWLPHRNNAMCVWLLYRQKRLLWWIKKCK